MFNKVQWYYTALHKPSGRSSTKQAESGLSFEEIEFRLPYYKQGERLTRDDLQQMVQKWNVQGAGVWEYSILGGVEPPATLTTNTEENHK